MIPTGAPPGRSRRFCRPPRPHGVSRALIEVLERARNHLEANEQAEAARHVRLLLERSGLTEPEFASRIGVAGSDLGDYLDAAVSPPASLMIRMRRLSDRFAKMRAQRAQERPRDEPADEYPEPEPR